MLSENDKSINCEYPVTYAREIENWSKKDTKKRLFSKECIKGFKIISSSDYPGNETGFEVRFDDRYLYVSVISFESGVKGLNSDVSEKDTDIVEVFFDPYADNIGYLQFICTNSGKKQAYSHWPYRDSKKNSHRDPIWDVEVEYEQEGADLLRFYFFKFDISVIKVSDFIGFNVCRTQVDLAESSSWSVVSGIGFADPGCFGRLYFKESDIIKETIFSNVQINQNKKLMLQGTYDWPDHIGNVIYSPENLRDEMKWYSQYLERIYWLDYAVEDTLLKKSWMQTNEKWSKNIKDSYKVFGEDFLAPAVKYAHEADMEFITIFKPFDMSKKESFVAEHPEYQVSLNSDWENVPNFPIKKIRIFQNSEKGFPFDKTSINLYTSVDNNLYDKFPIKPEVKEYICERKDFVWSPSGTVESESESIKKVRCLEISGIHLYSYFFALEFKKMDISKTISNREYMLAELIDSNGKSLPFTLDYRYQNTSKNSFNFGPRLGNAPTWSRSDTQKERLLTLSGAVLSLGFSLKQEKYLDGFLDHSNNEVQEFFLEKLQRGIDAGADGISIRIAHHVGCIDWLSYMCTETILKEFKKRTGRKPQANNEDYTLIRIIRGDFYTNFLRKASFMARSNGIKFIHHLENRMLVPAEYDCYCQIYWDWKTWIAEGLLDEIDLKYIAPDSRDYIEDILPIAHKHNVKVNWITADLEPRNHPRSINQATLTVDKAKKFGLDGINLYELWLYRRMTSFGYPMTRGSAEAILKNLKKTNSIG